MTTNTQIAERRKTQAKNLPAAAKKCISSGFGFTIFAPLPVHISGIEKSIYFAWFWSWAVGAFLDLLANGIVKADEPRCALLDGN